MSKNEIQKKNRDQDLTDMSLLEKMEINFPTSKEDAWNNIESMMTEKPVGLAPDSVLRMRLLPVAATLLILLASIVVLRYYSVNYSAGTNYYTANLPDNSTVILDPGSEIRYYPLWWKFGRNLQLDGNAEFQVTKGNRFRVVSLKGITEVLGTTFRIEAGSEKYRVSCFTGSVKVTDRKSDVSAVIIANESASLTREGVFEIKLLQNENINENQNNIENDYITFHNEPIQNVFNKIESIFGINIELKVETGLYYSGNLKITRDLDTILNAICLPLDLEYVQTSNNIYLIRQSANKK